MEPIGRVDSPAIRWSNPRINVACVWYKYEGGAFSYCRGLELGAESIGGARGLMEWADLRINLASVWYKNCFMDLSLFLQLSISPASLPLALHYYKKHL